MRKTNLILKTAVAAALGLTAMGAIAGTPSFSAAPTYASEGIPGTGAVTIPQGITYTTDVASAGSSTTGLLTITLPTGVTFLSIPSLTADGAIVTSPSVANSPIGASSLVINYNRTAAAGGTVTLGAFQVTGATGLASPSTIKFSAQSSGFTPGNSTSNDSSAISVTLATSAKQLSVTPVASNLVIDVTSPSNATRWKVGSGSVAKSGNIGTLVVSNNPYLNATATAAFTFTSSTASATLSGNFAGVSSAYLAPALTTACSDTVPSGATAGVVTSSSVTFAGVKPSTDARLVCLGATGTTILQATQSGVPVSATQDAFTTTATTNLGSVTYNGGVTQISYVVGPAGGYTNYLRVVNNDSVSTDVRVVVQSDSGAINSGLLGTLAPNTSQLYSITQVNTATGSTLNTAGDRASITALTPTKNATVSNLLVNPTGVVVNIQ